MKLRTLLLLVSMIMAACTNNQKSSREKLDYIFSTKYEHSIISKGDNLPNFDRRKDSLGIFLVALHEGIEPEIFQKRVNWSEELLEERIQFLLERGWLMRDERESDLLYSSPPIIRDRTCSGMARPCLKKLQMPLRKRSHQSWKDLLPVVCRNNMILNTCPSWY